MRSTLLVFLGALIAGLPAAWLLPLLAALVVVSAVSALIRGTAQWDAARVAALPVGAVRSGGAKPVRKS